MEPECQRTELSLFSVGGMTQYHTMKLQGNLQGTEVPVLIDSGASHNFIAIGLVEKK